jgi:hypothetical protein
MEKELVAYKAEIEKRYKNSDMNKNFVFPKVDEDDQPTWANGEVGEQYFCQQIPNKTRSH